MADKTIGELPSIANVTDASLIPIEQSGVAGKMTGAQFKAWGAAAAQPSADAAAQSAQAAANSATAASGSATSAAGSATSAGNSATAAAASRQAIENLGVASNALDPGSAATVAKTVSQQGVVTLTFGIPRGATGSQGVAGAQGPQGVQGPKGDTGTAVAVETQGMYYFNVDNDSSSPTFGHLFLTYTGQEAPSFSINQQGHLVWTVEEE
jgi:hypothetical protein